MNNITICSPNKKIIYNDTEDHFKNGLLRLLSLNKDQFNKWLEYSEQSNKESLIEKLTDGFSNLNNINIVKNNINAFSNLWETSGNIWHDKIIENKDYGIAISNNRELAWLTKNGIQELNPPVYEENYFEGNDGISGGYGDYQAQSSWRLEKATRQVQEMINITGLNSGNILDVGSGYGYFRKALNDTGFNHHGVEISKHACKVAKNIFNFKTYHGILENYLDDFSKKFDIITLWDVIEHISDPIKFLKQIKQCLKPNGFAIIKTPNIDCPEVNIFKNYYHSFKREHLIYFSPKSLTKCANLAEFNIFMQQSTSHLLQGFFEKNQINLWEKDLNGTDLIFYIN